MNWKSILAIGVMAAVGAGTRSSELDKSLEFFRAHDLDNSQAWDHTEIPRMYGAQPRSRIVAEVLRATDINRDGSVTLDEWRVFVGKSKKLPAGYKVKRDFTSVKSVAQQFGRPRLAKSLAEGRIPKKYRTT